MSEQTSIIPKEGVVFENNVIDGRGIVGYDVFNLLMVPGTADLLVVPVDVGPQAQPTTIPSGQSFMVFAWLPPPESGQPATVPDKYVWVPGAAGPLVTPGAEVATDGE
jgi:hypothetical protein